MGGHDELAGIRWQSAIVSASVRAGLLHVYGRNAVSGRLQSGVLSQLATSCKWTDIFRIPVTKTQRPTEQNRTSTHRLHNYRRPHYLSYGFHKWPYMETIMKPHTHFFVLCCVFLVLCASSNTSEIGRARFAKDKKNRQIGVCRISSVFFFSSVLQPRANPQLAAMTLIRPQSFRNTQRDTFCLNSQTDRFGQHVRNKREN